MYHLIQKSGTQVKGVSGHLASQIQLRFFRHNKDPKTPSQTSRSGGAGRRLCLLLAEEGVKRPMTGHESHALALLSHAPGLILCVLGLLWFHKNRLRFRLNFSPHHRCTGRDAAPRKSNGSSVPSYGCRKVNRPSCSARQKMVTGPTMSNSR